MLPWLSWNSLGRPGLLGQTTLPPNCHLQGVIRQNINYFILSSLDF
ncbi:hypothetical protein LEMLEM_LOCUS18327 [Lemmus lemmus]